MPKRVRFSSAKPVYRTVRTSRLYEQIVQQVEDSI
jgi:hypothetical protein